MTARHVIQAASAILAYAFVVGATPVQADIISGSGTGGISLTATPPVVPGPIPPGTAFPRLPATLSYLGGTTTGNSGGFLAMGWDFSPSSAMVIIPDSPPASSTTFLVQSSPDGGMATLTGTFSVTFGLDAAGLPASTVSTAYMLIGEVGPGTGGFVAFDAELDFTSSALGAIPSAQLLLHFDSSTPGGFGALVSDTGTLPVLPGLDMLTIDGFFRLQALDNPGGGSTEIDVHQAQAAVPEPSTLFLLSGTALMLLLAGRRTPRLAPDKSRSPIRRSARQSRIC
jgi:hypothetical protein